MRRLLTILFLLCSSIYGNSPLTLFTIDASVRGVQIANLVTTYTSAPFISGTSEFGIQTNITYVYGPYIVNSFIPYVQGVTAAPNSTLFIVKYYPRGASQAQYVVAGVENITSLVYQTQTIPTTGFTSTFATGSQPLVFVDPVKRAADIDYVCNNLLNNTIYATGTSKIAIQTTLSGPFYPPLARGYITNVLNISVLATGSPYLVIKYYNNQAVTGTIFVSAEQVQQIEFFPRGY